MSNTRKTKPARDLAAMLATARLPERTVALCLRGDLQARLEELQREHDEATSAAKGAAASLAGDPARADLESAIDTLIEEMRDSVLILTMRALNPAELTMLQVAHPPSDEDKAKGLAVDWQPYRLAQVRACIVDPDFDDEQWTRFQEVITPGQRKILEDTIDVLNHSPVDVPFSSAASRRTPPSDGS